MNFLSLNKINIDYLTGILVDDKISTMLLERLKGFKAAWKDKRAN
jgi:hypothetical protein